MLQNLSLVGSFLLSESCELICYFQFCIFYSQKSCDDTFRFQILLNMQKLSLQEG